MTPEMRSSENCEKLLTKTFKGCDMVPRWFLLCNLLCQRRHGHRRDLQVTPCSCVSSPYSIPNITVGIMGILWILYTQARGNIRIAHKTHRLVALAGCQHWWLCFTTHSLSENAWLWWRLWQRVVPWGTRCQLWGPFSHHLVVACSEKVGGETTPLASGLRNPSTSSLCPKISCRSNYTCEPRWAGQ